MWPLVRREGWWTDDPIEEKLLFLASVESAKIPTKDVFRFFSLRCVLLKWTCFQVDAMEKISIRVLISLPLTCPFPLNASSTQLLYRRVALLDVFLKVHNTFSYIIALLGIRSTFLAEMLIITIRAQFLED